MNKLRFYSAVLTRMPPDARRYGVRRLLFRGVLLSGLLLSLFAVVVFVHLRAMPIDGGQLLYRLHDEVYLPLVGQTFTRFFPWSVIWWGIGLTALVWLLLMWVFDASPLRFVHRRLLLRAIRRPTHHAGLVRWSRRFSRVRFRPHFLRLIADDEWQRCLRATDFNAALSLLDLRIQLQNCFPLDTARILSLLEDWQRLALMLYRLDATSDQWQQMQKLLVALQIGSDQDADDQYFSPAALYTDVQRSLRWLQRPDQPDASLLQANDARRQRLNTVYASLHQAYSGSKTAGKLLLPAVPSELLSICGRIALRLTLQTAYLAAYPAHLRAYVAASERLGLLARAVPMPAARSWAVLLGECNEEQRSHDVYAELANLNETEQMQKSEQWRSQNSGKGQALIATEDHEIAAWIGVQQLIYAAYPDSSNEQGRIREERR